MASITMCAGVIHLLAAASSVPAGAGEPRVTAPPPAILGVWVVNRDQTDDPREIMRARREAEAQRRSGRRGGMGGPHVGGADFGPMRQIREEVMVAPERFTISERRGDLVFAYEGGRTALITPDGKKFNDKLEDVEIKAKWQGDHLVVERKYYFGATLVEEYFVSPETHQLFVQVEFDPGHGDPVKFRRVFDRSAPVEDS